MNKLLRLSYIQAVLPGLAMLAVPAGASAQPRIMGARMGSPAMARPAGSATMAQPFRGSATMTPAMQPMSAGGRGISPMASGGYGMASYDMDGTQAYGATATYGATGVNTNSSAYSAEPQLSPEQKSMSRLLSASGVPNDKGQLRWPLGLAILAAPEADALCDQIDALFEVAASQAAGGQVNPVLVEEAQRAVTKLRRLLLKDKAKRFGMPLAVYEESERFLDKLDRADQFLRAGMGTPAGQRPVTKASSTTDSTGSHK